MIYILYMNTEWFYSADYTIVPSSEMNDYVCLYA